MEVTDTFFMHRFFPTPPAFIIPYLQFMHCYIARYYVKIVHSLNSVKVTYGVMFNRVVHIWSCSTEVSIYGLVQQRCPYMVLLNRGVHIWSCSTEVSIYGLAQQRCPYMVLLNRGVHIWSCSTEVSICYM